MGHNPSRQRIREADRANALEHNRIEGPQRDAARRLIALWNLHLASGWRSMFYPTIRTAMRAGAPWLHVLCTGCNTEGECDLRTLDIHPEATIAVVIRAMSCRACSPHVPFARPIGLTRRSWQRRDQPWKIRRHSFVTYAYRNVWWRRWEAVEISRRGNEPLHEPMGWGESQRWLAKKSGD